MNNTELNCTCIIEDESSIDYIITQTFGWLTGILALAKIFFFTITLLIKKYSKNISWIFTIIGIIGSICAIIFGVRINEISVYVRGAIMLTLSIIICVAKIIFDKEYDEKQKKIEIEMSEKYNNDKDIIQKLEDLIINNNNKIRINYKKNDINFSIINNKIIINSITLDYSNKIVRNLIDYMKDNIDVIIEE